MIFVSIRGSIICPFVYFVYFVYFVVSFFYTQATHGGIAVRAHGDYP